MLVDDGGGGGVLVPLVARAVPGPLFAQNVVARGAAGVAGTLGFAAVGTLFAAMLVRARSRDVLLPVLLYPITVPVIIAGVRGTGALFEAPADVATAWMWVGMLAAFDAVFVTLALWTFEPVMTD
jgi:heme exporter protein B